MTRNIFRDQFPNYRPIQRLMFLVVKILIVNVSDQLRYQFIIKTILITNLEINYNFYS